MKKIIKGKNMCKKFYILSLLILAAAQIFSVEHYIIKSTDSLSEIYKQVFSMNPWEIVVLLGPEYNAGTDEYKLQTLLHKFNDEYVILNTEINALSRTNFIKSKIKCFRASLFHKIKLTDLLSGQNFLPLTGSDLSKDNKILNIIFDAFLKFSSSLYTKEPEVDFIVYSFNRPLLLHAFLKSVKKYVSGLRKLFVIYRSDDKYIQAYKKLQQEFSDYVFITQC